MKALRLKPDDFLEGGLSDIDGLRSRMEKNSARLRCCCLLNMAGWQMFRLGRRRTRNSLEHFAG
jgi:hypothetical protein